MHLRLRQIRYFVEIVNAGSMSKAAGRLNLVPNALSLQVKSLEEGFGVELLKSHAHGVSPTSTGWILYDHAQRILGLLDATERELNSNGLPRITYRMGVMPSVLHAVSLRAIRPESGQKKHIHVDLIEAVSEDASAMLREGGLDFAIACDVSDPPFGHSIEVLEEELVYVTSPDNAVAHSEVSLSHALGSELIRFGDENRVWNIVARAAATEGLQLRAAHVAESADLLRRMLCAGMGCAILPIGLVRDEWHKETVSVFRISCSGLKRRVSILWRDAWATSADEAEILRYAEGMVTSYHQRTIPFSKILAPVVPINQAATA